MFMEETEGIVGREEMEELDDPEQQVELVEPVR